MAAFSFLRSCRVAHALSVPCDASIKTSCSDDGVKAGIELLVRQEVGEET